MRVGELEILPVIDGVARLPISEPFLGMPAEAWAPHRQFLNADGMLELALGGFLLRGNGRVALIDTGVGAMSGLFAGGAFLDHLASYGVAPDDVTDVLFTHLHFDHVGWATQQGRVVFEQATYRCDERDWGHFVGPDPGATRKLSPLADRMSFWSSGGPVLPGLDAMITPGHTPGSTVFVVSDRNERAMLLGDVVHCPVELLDEEWAGMGDVDPELAKRTKLALAKELEGSTAHISAAHFPGLQFGKLLAGNGKRQWVID